MKWDIPFAVVRRDYSKRDNSAVLGRIQAVAAGTKRGQAMAYG